MERESKLGRFLWIALVVVLVGYVASDFARSPFLAQRGSAAVRPTQLTLWVPAGADGGNSAELVRDAASGLELQGHPTAVKALQGGASEAVAKFLWRSHPHEGDLLVLTSSTLAGIAHDRLDRLVPGAAEQALLATELLRRSTPVALLASERLALGVASGSPIDDAQELVDSLRSEPSAQLAAIGDDSWTRVELAELVKRAGVEGDIRFSVFHSTGEAGNAVGSGLATTFLGTRGTLLDEVSKSRLREIEWPFGNRQAPRFWVALVAAPHLPPARIAKLRGWIASLHDDRDWRQQLRAGGSDVGTSHGALPGLLEREIRKANQLELVSREVEEG